MSALLVPLFGLAVALAGGIIGLVVHRRNAKDLIRLAELDAQSDARRRPSSGGLHP